MITLEQKVITALSTVQDPDLKKDLVSLKMIDGLEVSDGVISFNLKLTTPACPLKEMIKRDCIAAIHKYLGSEWDVQVQFASQVTSSRIKENLLPKVKNIIAIASGKGGVGKSTIAVNIAISLAKYGAQVGLLDADIYGPSIPIMLGCENQKTSVEKIGDRNFIIPLKKHGIKFLSIGFFTQNSKDAIVWRGPMASKALCQLITDALWGDLDYFIVDLPPGTSDIHLSLVQLVPVTGVVIVTTPQKISIEDAIKGLEMFKKKQINVPILGLIENMAYFTPINLPQQKYYIFGNGGGVKLAQQYCIPFLGSIPIIQSICDGADLGIPDTLNDGIAMNIFNDLSMALAQQIAIRNVAIAPTEIVNKN